MPDLLLRTNAEIKVYLEADGVAVPGRTVLVTVYSPSRATLVDGATGTDLDDGWYSYELAANILLTQGTYTAVWSSAGSPELNATTYHSCGYVAPGTPTRADLRLRVARELRAAIHRGQVGEGGDAGTIIDPTIVWGSDGEYVGGWFLGTSGANLGARRRITAYNASTHSLTIAPPLVGAPNVNDRYQMLAYDPDDIDDALNDAIRAIADRARVRVTDESTVTVADQDTYDVPFGLTAVYDVAVQTLDGGWNSLGAEDWTLLPGSRFQLTIAPADDNLLIRVAGLTLPGTLEADASYATLSPEYLVIYAAEALHAEHGAGQSTDPDDHRRVQPFYSTRREQERKRAIGRVPNNCRGVLP